MFPVTVLNDPSNLAGAEHFDVPDGSTIADVLLDYFGADGFAVPTEVYHGALAADARVDVLAFDAVNVPLTGPLYVLERPQGGELLIYILISVAVAVAVTLLMPLPNLPSGDGRSARRSPNNALSGQTNIARTLGRVPDPFGQVLSYPDLIAPTVTQFVDHIKYLTEYVTIGRGFYDLTDFKSGETLISAIPGSSATVYAPGTNPPLVLKTRQSNEVASQRLPAPNATGGQPLTQDYLVGYTTGTDVATINSTNVSENTWAGFTVGDTIGANFLWAATGGTDYNLVGSYVVSAISADGSTLSLADAAVENSAWSNFNGITSNVLFFVMGGMVSPTVTLPSTDAFIGPFVIPGTDRNDEVWLDLQAPSGLARGLDLNQPVTVVVRFVFEEIDSSGDPTGDDFTVLITLTDDTRDPRFWTYKITPANSDFVVNTRYRVTANRQTFDEPATLTRVDEIRWTRLAGIENITAADTTGTTRAIIQAQATEQVASLQERKFNVQATRKTVTWDGSAVVGNIATGAGLVASRKMADALLHYLLDPKLAASTLAALDVQAVYDVQTALNASFSGEKGEFSYTFDDKNLPALEEMRLIVQACRVFLYKTGSVFSVIRDEVQPVARGLFNRRNKKPDAETRSVRFNRPLDTDGVAVEYNDLTDNNTRVLTFPDDLPASDPNHGVYPNAVNPLRIEATGIRQWSQAWDRAQYEFRRQIYRRVTVESTVTLDGALLPLNARIQHVDGTRIAALTSDGEVLAVSGLTVTTSQDCTFAAGGHSVVLRDADGTPADAAITVTARPDGLRGFVLATAAPFTIKVRGDDAYQRGTLYSFGPDGNDVAEAYLVQRKTPDERGNIRLELINYTDQYYAADTTTPPTRPAL